MNRVDGFSAAKVPDVPAVPDVPENAVTIRRGTAVAVLTPSTEEDFDYINANLRTLDKFEQDHFIAIGDTDRRDSLEQMEKSWTLHLKGETVGYVALQVLLGFTRMSNIRYVPMLSTVNVEHHPIDYARLSRPVLEYIASQAPSWVDTFFSAPLSRYEQSVKWHEKTMGWHRVGEYDVGGEMATLFKTTRKELIP